MTGPPGRLLPTVVAAMSALAGRAGASDRLETSSLRAAARFDSLYEMPAPPSAVAEPPLERTDARPVPTPARGRPVALPTRWFEGRFIVEPAAPGGQTVAFFTDTGGALLIQADAVARLGLTPSEVDGPQGKYQVVTLPDFSPDRSIPPPFFGDAAGRITIVPADADMRRELGAADGMLGATWFGGRVWTFDYPGKTLWWRADGDAPSVDSSHAVRLGFKPGEAYPRIVATIDGEQVDLLFDTGATSILTPEAAAAIGDGRPSNRAGSMISESVFARWRRRHPDWRVIDAAERWGERQPIIEVPRVTIGGYSAGPVWFLRRTDADFHDYMSQVTDRQLEGALGGNALREFRVTVDYPNAVAYFER